MRKTPCAAVKASLKKEGVIASECNCCGLWEKDANGKPVRP